MVAGPLKALCLLLISPLLCVMGKGKEVCFSFFLTFTPSRFIHNVKPLDENDPVWPDNGELQTPKDVL